MNLNNQQTQVVKELDHHILLLASAGTGKTEVLSQRINEIIKTKRAKPEEILCLTFTNKACKEMQARIETVGSKVIVKTFHSFCFSLIKEFAKARTDIYTDFIIYDDDEAKEVVNQTSTNHPKELYLFIQLMKEMRARHQFLSDNNEMDYEKTLSYIKKNEMTRVRNICSEKDHVNEACLEFLMKDGFSLLLQYQQTLNENHALDFNDLILNVRKLLNDDAVCLALQKRFKYINIDEVQDTSDIEYEIIKRLFGNSVILMGGDLFQTLYEWRGSTPTLIFETFKTDYHPIEISFSVNYRATKCLTRASTSYLEKTFPSLFASTYPNGVTAASTLAGEKILNVSTENIKAESDFIYNQLLNYQSRGDNLAKACILTRSNQYAKDLSQLLNQKSSLQFTVIDDYKFFRRKEIKDILAFLKLRLNQSDSLSLKRILTLLSCGVGKETLKAIDSDAMKAVGIHLADFIQMEIINGNDRYDALQQSLAQNDIVVFDVETTGIDVSRDEIIQIAAIRLNHYGQELDRFVRFIKPNASVGASSLVHKFTDDYLAIHGENKQVVLKEFIAFIKGATIIGHNVGFDLSILRHECTRSGLSVPPILSYDTLDLYRRFYPNLQNHKLETLCTHFKTKHRSSHDALDDILATAELLTRIINEKIKPTRQQRLTYYAAHRRRFEPFAIQFNAWLLDVDPLMAYDMVRHAIHTFKLLERYPESEQESRRKYLGEFYQLLKVLHDSSQTPYQSVSETVKLTSLSNGELDELMLQQTKAVRIPIITVHQAKGLEFDTVFIAGMQNNTFPTYYAMKLGKLEEEKRAFYVALTRAKKRTVMTHVRKNKFGYSARPSMFLEDIPWKFVEVMSI